MDGDVYNKLIITNARYIKKVYFSIYLYICNNWFIIYIIQPDMDYHHEWRNYITTKRKGLNNYICLIGW